MTEATVFQSDVSSRRIRHPGEVAPAASVHVADGVLAVGDAVAVGSHRPRPRAPGLNRTRLSAYDGDGPRPSIKRLCDVLQRLIERTYRQPIDPKHGRPAGYSGSGCVAQVGLVPGLAHLTSDSLRSHSHSAPGGPRAALPCGSSMAPLQHLQFGRRDVHAGALGQERLACRSSSVFGDVVLAFVVAFFFAIVVLLGWGGPPARRGCAPPRGHVVLGLDCSVMRWNRPA